MRTACPNLACGSPQVRRCTVKVRMHPALRRTLVSSCASREEFMGEERERKMINAKVKLRYPESLLGTTIILWVGRSHQRRQSAVYFSIPPLSLFLPPSSAQSCSLLRYKTQNGCVWNMFLLSPASNEEVFVPPVRVLAANAALRSAVVLYVCFSRNFCSTISCPTYLLL